MKEFLRLVIVLFAICLAAGGLLAVVNQVTKAPIAEAMRQEKLAALRQVLPPYDNQPDSDTVVIEEDGEEWSFFVGRQDGAYTGAAFEVAAPKGYGGTIRLLVGVNAEGSVQGLAILEQKETPGLGAKIKDDKFRGQFKGLSVSDTKWKVRKDGGDIDEITAATISSRAVVEAVAEGLAVYGRHKASVQSGAAQ
jgi:electron transport complex protein RnfG